MQEFVYYDETVSLIVRAMNSHAIIVAENPQTVRTTAKDQHIDNIRVIDYDDFKQLIVSNHVVVPGERYVIDNLLKCVEHMLVGIHGAGPAELSNIIIEHNRGKYEV